MCKMDILKHYGMALCSDETGGEASDSDEADVMRPINAQSRSRRRHRRRSGRSAAAAAGGDSAATVAVTAASEAPRATGEDEEEEGEEIREDAVISLA